MSKPYLTTFRNEVTVHDDDSDTTLDLTEAQACRRLLAFDDVLTALQGFLRADPDVFRDELAAARAAIAKVRGQ